MTEPAIEPEPDPRIGSKVTPTATQIGYDDGTVYAVKKGIITRRIV